MSMAHFPQHPTEILPDVPPAASRQIHPSPPSSERMMMMRHSRSEGAMWPRATAPSGVVGMLIPEPLMPAAASLGRLVSGCWGGSLGWVEAGASTGSGGGVGGSGSSSDDCINEVLKQGSRHRSCCDWGGCEGSTLSGLGQHVRQESSSTECACGDSPPPVGDSGSPSSCFDPRPPAGIRHISPAAEFPLCGSTAAAAAEASAAVVVSLEEVTPKTEDGSDGGTVGAGRASVGGGKCPWHRDSMGIAKATAESDMVPVSVAHGEEIRTGSAGWSMRGFYRLIFGPVSS